MPTGLTRRGCGDGSDEVRSGHTRNGMETCGGSHFLGRALRERGHEVRQAALRILGGPLVCSVEIPEFAGLRSSALKAFLGAGRARVFVINSHALRNPWLHLARP